MKTKQELKEELHRLIDSIEDEQVLNELNEDVVPYMIASRNEPAEDDDLTEEQEKELREAIAEADRSETISFEEFKKSTDRWRTELKSTKGLG
jgi:hypothetical protein